MNIAKSLSFYQRASFWSKFIAAAHIFSKTTPNGGKLFEQRHLERNVQRLAETSPHLLKDIGIQPDNPAVRDRLGNVPALDIVRVV